MNCLWWDGNAKTLNYEQAKDVGEGKELESGEVLVAVAFSGVCGSDFAYMKGNMGKHNAKQDGVILGHEFSGRVIQVASDVVTLKVGDRVVVDPNSSCGSGVCGNDDSKSPHFCEHNDAVGVKRNGGWSQKCRVPAHQVYKIPDELPLDVAALCEPFSCVLRGWDRIGADLPDAGTSRVLIQGAGIIGVLFSLLLRHHGFNDVTIAEISDGRRRAVKKYLPGHYRVEDPTIVVERVGSQADSEGFHLIIDCTGNVHVFQKDIELACRGGVILGFGCCPSGTKIQIEPFQIYWKELKLLGSFLNPRCFPEAIRLLNDINSNKWIKLDQMGVEKYPLHDYGRALERLKTGVASKILFQV